MTAPLAHFPRRMPVFVINTSHAIGLGPTTSTSPGNCALLPELQSYARIILFAKCNKIATFSAGFQVTDGSLLAYLAVYAFSVTISSKINSAEILAWLRVLPGRLHFYSYSDTSLSAHLHFEYPVTTEAPSLKRPLVTLLSPILPLCRRYQGAGL